MQWINHGILLQTWNLTNGWTNHPVIILYRDVLKLPFNVCLVWLQASTADSKQCDTGREKRRKKENSNYDNKRQKIPLTFLPIHRINGLPKTPHKLWINTINTWMPLEQFCCCCIPLFVTNCVCFLDPAMNSKNVSRNGWIVMLKMPPCSCLLSVSVGERGRGWTFCCWFLD